MIFFKNLLLALVMISSHSYADEDPCNGMLSGNLGESGKILLSAAGQSLIQHQLYNGRFLTIDLATGNYELSPLPLAKVSAPITTPEPENFNPEDYRFVPSVNHDLTFDKGESSEIKQIFDNVRLYNDKKNLVGNLFFEITANGRLLKFEPQNIKHEASETAIINFLLNSILHEHRSVFSIDGTLSKDDTLLLQKIIDTGLNEEEAFTNTAFYKNLSKFGKIETENGVYRNGSFEISIDREPLSRQKRAVTVTTSTPVAAVLTEPVQPTTTHTSINLDEYQFDRADYKITSDIKNFHIHNEFKDTVRLYNSKENQIGSLAFMLSGRGRTLKINSFNIVNQAHESMIIEKLIEHALIKYPSIESIEGDLSPEDTTRFTKLTENGMSEEDAFQKTFFYSSIKNICSLEETSEIDTSTFTISISRKKK